MKLKLSVLALAMGLTVGALAYSQKALWADKDASPVSEITLRKLAEQGNVNAQARLGHMYASGEGTKQDWDEAVKWYRLAAEQGNAEAQNNLGDMYYSSRGLPQDDTEAVKWYRLAAEQGNARAQNSLGLKYEFGYGVPQDYVTAHKWFNLAAANASSSDPGIRELAILNRDIVAKKMTPDQIAEAQKLAREWKPKVPSNQTP